MLRLRRRFRVFGPALLGALLAACGAGAVQPPPPEVPDKVDRLGELDIVTRTHAARSANYDTWDQSQSWSLRWRGQPVVIDSFSGMWMDQPARFENIQSLFTLTAAEPARPPDILVLVGDPNNGASFHLVRQRDGKLETPLACITLAGNNAVHVLDGPATGASFAGPVAETLVGARHLLLGRDCILDVTTGRTAAVPPLPPDLFLPYGAGRVLLLSPDGRTVARLAGRSDDSNELLLAQAVLGVYGAKVDLHANPAPAVWRTLAIDPDRMRYTRFEDVDIAWLRHHFEWRRGKDGRDSLVERAGFKPLPRRGVYLESAAQYSVPHVTVDGTEVFTDFLARFPGARRLPDYRYEHSGQVVRQVEIEGETAVVMPDGFYVALTGKPYYSGQPGDPALTKKMVHRLGDAFDAELAAGRHDALFAGPRSSR